MFGESATMLTELTYAQIEKECLSGIMMNDNDIDMDASSTGINVVHSFPDNEVVMEQGDTNVANDIEIAKEELAKKKEELARVEKEYAIIVKQTAQGSYMLNYQLRQDKAMRNESCETPLVGLAQYDPMIPSMNNDTETHQQQASSAPLHIAADEQPVTGYDVLLPILNTTALSMLADEVDKAIQRPKEAADYLKGYTTPIPQYSYDDLFDVNWGGSKYIKDL